MDAGGGHSQVSIMTGGNRGNMERGEEGAEHTKPKE